MLDQVRGLAVERMQERLRESGYPDVRPGHGCVFRFIDKEAGSRLTELAALSGLTKQAVGEVVVELERLGYVHRVPDPTDGRAKTIRLTQRGQAGYMRARELFEEVENDWAEQVGKELMACLREAAERIIALERDGAPSR